MSNEGKYILSDWVQTHDCPLITIQTHKPLRHAIDWLEHVEGSFSVCASSVLQFCSDKCPDNVEESAMVLNNICPVRIKYSSCCLLMFDNCVRDCQQAW